MDLNERVTANSHNHNQIIKEEEKVTLDTILVHIGQFGKFQINILLLICIPMMFSAIFSVAYVFTAGTVIYRCNITECDDIDSKYDEPWTEYAIPYKSNSVLDRCHRYAANLTDNLTNFNAEFNYNTKCKNDHFDRNNTQPCSTDNLIFRDSEETISNEFHIYCKDEWKLSMVGTLNNIGQFIGIPIGGYISDMYGRRTSLILCSFIAGILGIIRSFATSYVFFVVFEILDSIASSSIYSVCFIIGIELVGPQKRVLACCLITVFYALGEILLALFAKYYQNWRILLRILYGPTLALVAYFWILPESVRWLLSQNRDEEAKLILKQASAVNRSELPDRWLEKLVTANDQKLRNSSEKKFPIREAFDKFFWRIANCSYCWIVNVLVYYGLSLSAVLLHGNKYNNFMLIAMIEIPGFFLPLVTMDRFGRRYTLCGYMLVCGLCCLGTIFLTSDNYYIQLVLFLLGKMAITASFQVLYFFTSEIFPTTLRNSLLSFCSMMGRFGSMLAAQTPLLAKYSENAPPILFAITALTSAGLSLLLPETTNKILPNTVKEANDIGGTKKTNATAVEDFVT
ncbi:organic cation transporter protein isoform X1 [Glossina fuscipes]|uniref:Organic cation transporter protein isoform X1 n=1 Tax=Glossina fuscipes TaxID=7396 RepID=A0A9C5ZM13_9MUSC|nr:organic cation transporter protein isoform X1 [Glossina fuscipes]XP_037901373.1 organic cation transporter protein isoform X1 [Glossina fuscipes]